MKIDPTKFYPSEVINPIVHRRLLSGRNVIFVIKNSFFLYIYNTVGLTTNRLIFYYFKTNLKYKIEMPWTIASNTIYNSLKCRPHETATIWMPKHLLKFKIPLPPKTKI